MRIGSDLLLVCNEIDGCRRLKNLRVIVNALTASILPVANVRPSNADVSLTYSGFFEVLIWPLRAQAFLLMLIVTAIYAILGTEFYKDISPQNFSTFSVSLFSVDCIARHCSSCTFLIRIH